MIKDAQMKGLLKYMNSGKSLSTASACSGMSENSARKYLVSGKLPSQMQSPHHWNTHQDAFEDIWPWIASHLESFPALEAKFLFSALQRDHPGLFSDGQLRTLQRRMKVWRATEGPAKEIFFPQIHYPGDLCASDFTHMEKVGVTIQGQPFKHMLYHFVLTYSNWEDGTVCFSESFESLSTGFQNALWRLGGTVLRHRVDSLSAAVNNISEKHEFTERYKGLLAHYRMAGERINPREAHENGDIEQRHYRLKQAVKQTLILRGSFDFESRPDYEAFLRDMFVLLNKGRLKRFQEEAKVLCSLPRRRLDACRIEKGVRVSKFSTIRILRNTYSVHSRLRAECVDVHLYPEYLVVYYGQRKIIQLDRLYGSNKHSIHYSHIIESLVRKPGAFANYQYKSDLYPTSRFRIAYDKLGEQHGPTRDKCYVKLLHLAANESEAGVDRALSHLIDTEQPIDLDAIKALLNRFEQPVVCPDTAVRPVSLSDYDQLLTSTQEAA